MNVMVRADPGALAEAAADAVATAAERALLERGRFALALAGGATPRALYQRLATRPWSTRIAWGRTQVFFGDERAVPPDHPDSNYRMAYEALLAKVPVPADQVHRLEGERDDLGHAARDYAATLARVLGGAPNEPPRLDVVLLGLGEDGHTASIFPGTERLAAGPALVARVPAPAGGWRLTLTYPVLDAAREVLFLVAGAGKREMVRRLREGGGDPPIPAARVRPTRGTVTLFVDRAAAGEHAAH